MQDPSKPCDNDGQGSSVLLNGKWVPAVELQSTGGQLKLSELSGVSVIVTYSSASPVTDAHGVTCLGTPYNPQTGTGGAALQLQAFRDAFSALKAAGASNVVAVSTETAAQQLQTAALLRLPFPLVSDAGMQLNAQLPLPTMRMQGSTVLKEAVLISVAGRIEYIFYPMYPPDESAARVRRWLQHCV